MKGFSRLKAYVKAHKYVLCVLYIPVYLLCFFLVERHVPSTADYWVSYMALDDKIPFVEAFVIPYIMWYPFIIGVGLYLLLKDPPTLKKYMLFIVIGFTLSMGFCWIFPNGQNLRPAGFERDNVFTWIIGIIYAADTNTNVFPSMHVVGMLGGAFAIFESKKMRSFRVPGAVLTVLVSASTVFIKQHSFLDIIGGVALCLPLYFAIFSPLRAGKEHVGEN